MIIKKNAQYGQIIDVLSFKINNNVSKSVKQENIRHLIQDCLGKYAYL
jgi:hypothetical protein